MPKYPISEEKAHKILEDHFVAMAREAAKDAIFTEEEPEGVYKINDDPCWWTSGMPCEHPNTMIGATYRIGISKKTGKILYAGMYGE